MIIPTFLKSAWAYNIQILTSSVKGITFLKLQSSFKLALMLSPIYILDQVTKWSIANQDYIAIVLSAIAIDHLLGTIRHSRWFDNDFKLLKNITGLLTKTMLVVLMGVLFEELNHLVRDHQFITGFSITILRLTVFLYPFFSAIENSRVITNGKFPPEKWYKQINQFINNYKNK